MYLSHAAQTLCSPRRLERERKTSPSPQRTVADVEHLLRERTVGARQQTAKIYNEKNSLDINTARYENGERVIVHFPQDALVTGRKLRTAWRGPMTVEKHLTPTSYLLVPETTVDGLVTTRAHVDRMRKRVGEEEERWDRLFPDIQRLRGKVMGVKGTGELREWKLKHRGPKGFVWRKDQELPPALVGNLVRKGDGEMLQD